MAQVWVRWDFAWEAKPGKHTVTVQATDCNASDQDAVARIVLDKRWQRVSDGLGAEQSPFSQGTLCNFRLRLLQRHLDKTLLERTVALAERLGGGAR